VAVSQAVVITADAGLRGRVEQELQTLQARLRTVGVPLD
jgi:hypothetical protein